MCTLMVFETILNCREIDENKDGKWYILTVFGNAENILKKNDCKWCILTAFETTWKCRETFENKGGK